MNSTVLIEILAFLLGRKYYANIVTMIGANRKELCSYVFHTKAEADKHREELDTTLSFRFIETVSFRSRHDY